MIDNKPQTPGRAYGLRIDYEQLAITTREVAEALQALTNYLQAAHHIAGSEAPSSAEAVKRMAPILEKSIAEASRANAAFRVMCKLVRVRRRVSRGPESSGLHDDAQCQRSWIDLNQSTQLRYLLCETLREGADPLLFFR